ncbi:MAG: hypothetical protein Q9166_007634, partial [cf. Caloplaca sp. 2 TL-2023]
MRFCTKLLNIAACVFCLPYLCAAQIDRSGWNCNIDSWQIQGELQDCVKAIDGNDNTFWHTLFDPDPDPLPHYFKLDLGQVYQMTSFSYLPRQDGSKNGNIGEWQISMSADGENWQLFSGSWLDDQQLKTVDLMIGRVPTPARFVKLVAYTEAGSRGPWSSAAEFNLFDTSSPASDDLYSVPSIRTTHSVVDDLYKASPTTLAYSAASSHSITSTPTVDPALDTSPQQSSTSNTSPQQSSSSNSSKENHDDGGLNKIQTIATVIGTVA